MDSTPDSLLARLCKPGDPQSRAADWTRFVHLFTPLLYFWASRHGLRPQEAEDLVQEVFLTIVNKLPHLELNGERSFRGWLSTVLLNRLRDMRQRIRPLSLDPCVLQDLPDRDPAEALADAEFYQHLAQRALRLMEKDFEAATWQACWQTKVCGRPAREVAAELGLTVAAVHAATYRVLRRLRQELGSFFS
jgi:RNA polymerase sigma-70 factor (ECF subfamily)